MYISIYLFNDIFIVIYKSNLKPPATYIPSGAPYRENHGVTKMPVTVLFNTKKNGKDPPEKDWYGLIYRVCTPNFIWNSAVGIEYPVFRKIYHRTQF